MLIHPFRHQRYSAASLMRCVQELNGSNARTKSKTRKMMNSSIYGFDSIRDLDYWFAQTDNEWAEFAQEVLPNWLTQPLKNKRRGKILRET